MAGPSGRYLQYRAQFKGGTKDVLRRTAIYYLPQNRPTRVTSVELGSGAKKPSKITSKRIKARTPVLKVSWKVKNVDGDASTYQVLARREGEARWRPIVSGAEQLSSTEYSWNTETYPDGYYRLRVTASDKSANMAGRERTNSFTTPLFLLDNTRPKVADLTVKFPAVSARAVDSLSAISQMAYSIDDGPWLVGSPRDGIFDQPTEMLGVSLPKKLPPGIHTLAIRVTDEAGNIGAASVSFRR